MHPPDARPARARALGRGGRTHAQRVVAELQEDPHLKGAEDAVLPLLLVELGICQNWLGDLVAAEATLNAAVSLGRFRDLPVVAAAAASHLAFTEYMAGRERACVQVATEALDTLAALTWRTPFTEERARLALLLARLVDLPLSGREPTPSPGPVAGACGRPAHDVLAAAAQRASPPDGGFGGGGRAGAEHARRAAGHRAAAPAPRGGAAGREGVPRRSRVRSGDAGGRRDRAARARRRGRVRAGRRVARRPRR